MSEARSVRRLPEAQREPRRVAKLCGSDAELGNFLDGADDAGVSGERNSGAEASRALLEQFEGIGGDRRSSSVGSSYARYGGYGYGAYGYAYGGGYDPQDWGRKFLANGACAYIDLHHLEICTPEVLSAWDFVSASRAMLGLTQDAQRAANAARTDGATIQVLAHNSDGQSNSYGSHLSFLVTRRTFDNLFSRKLHQLLFLAAYQVSSIVITGQGKVGAECERPEADYQLSIRADFVETLVGTQTTYNRPIVNSRNESLAGRDLARIHCIFYDNNLCQVAELLKVGLMQIVLAMVEADQTRLDLLLDDPVEALCHWSRGVDLAARAPLTSGEDVTAVELQRRFLAEARRCAALGVLDTVPRHAELLDLWEDTLAKLEKGDLDELVGRLDWVLKKRVLERFLAQHPELGWDSPELKHLDLLYASLDPEVGLYWAYQRAGITESVVEAAAIALRREEPPANTRAFARAALLRLFGEERVSAVDWDEVEVRLVDDDGRSEKYRLALPDPLDPRPHEIATLLGPAETHANHDRH